MVVVVWAGPPDPTFMSRSFTSLPSRALANRDAQIGSTSVTLAALTRVWSLSACKIVASSARRVPWDGEGVRYSAANSNLDTVIGEDEGCVGGGKLRVRHFVEDSYSDCRQFSVE